MVCALDQITHICKFNHKQHMITSQLKYSTLTQRAQLPPPSLPTTTAVTTTHQWHIDHHHTPTSTHPRHDNHHYNTTEQHEKGPNDDSINRCSGPRYAFLECWVFFLYFTNVSIQVIRLHLHHYCATQPLQRRRQEMGLETCRVTWMGPNDATRRLGQVHFSFYFIYSCY